MSTEGQTHEHEEKPKDKGIYSFIQPPTDGEISPAIRKIRTLKSHKNNSKKSLPQKHPPTTSQHPRLPRKSTNPETLKSFLSTLRKNLEETSPISRPSKEVSKHKNCSRKSSSSTQSGIPLVSPTLPVMSKEMMFLLARKWAPNQNQSNNPRNNSLKSRKNQRNSKRKQ